MYEVFIVFMLTCRQARKYLKLLKITCVLSVCLCMYLGGVGEVIVASVLEVGGGGGGGGGGTGINLVETLTKIPTRRVDLRQQNLCFDVVLT